MAETFKRNETTGKWERTTKRAMYGNIRMAAANGARRNPAFMNS